MTGANQSGVGISFGYDTSGRLSSSGAKWLGWTDTANGKESGLGLDSDYKSFGKYNLTDRLGSVVGQVDPSTGVISNRSRFGPFGEPAAGNAGFTGFCGRDYVASGVLYFRNRMYSPLLGRFLSEDPIGFSGSPDGNFFAYCGNDPVNYIDPLGLWGFGIGGTKGHPALWFGDMPDDGGGGVPATYRCSGGDDDPDAWMDGPNLRMSSAHVGMDGKSERSRWAHHAAGELGKQVTGAAVALGTAGVGAALEAVGEAATLAGASSGIAESGGANVILWHGTSESAASSILKNGFRPGPTFFGTPDVAWHFASGNPNAIIGIKLTASQAEGLSISRGLIGHYNDLKWVDVGDGMEAVVENIGVLNDLILGGKVTVKVITR